MKTPFIPTPTINNVQEFATLNLKRGQWVKLAWCDRKSRYASHKTDEAGKVTYVEAYHYPRAATIFWHPKSS